MNFGDCIQAAVNAGELDPERGRLARNDWEDLAKRYEASGASAADARQAAADELVERMRHATQKRRHVTVRQLMKLQDNEARYTRAATEDPDLLLKDIDAAHSEARTIFKQAMGDMQDFLADHSEDIAGRVRGRAQLADIVRDLHGQDSGNPRAKAIAQSIERPRERLRNLFNSHGGDIGKLDDYGVAHVHDGKKIRDAGFQAWADDLYARLDWNRITDHRTGKAFAVAKGAKPLRADADRFLNEVYQNITTKGWHDRTPGFSMGAKALFNARAEHRVLHFKTGDDWMAYNDAFGARNPFESIVGQIEGISKDIALMRAFGPNPKAGLENAIQVMQKAATLAPRNPKASKSVIKQAMRIGLQPEELVEKKAHRARVMMRALSGEANVPADGAMAAMLGHTRNLLTAAQLGSATLSQVTDLVSMRIAAKAIGLNPNSPLKRMFGDILSGMDRQTARDLGFIMDSWAQSSVTAARFAGDIWSPELTGRISNFVLKANGMTFLTDRARIAVAMGIGSDLAQMAGRRFDELVPNLRNFMEARGIGAREWDLLRDPAVIYTDPTGGKHLNPNWFREHSGLPAHEAEDLAIRFGAMIEDHIEMSIPSFSLRGRAAVIGDTKAGTLSGELMRSFGMYKGFALSQLFNQIRRVHEMDGTIGTKAWYGVSAFVQLTVMGALAVQLKEIVKGRDPRPMNPMDNHEFWYAAMLQGGGVGIFGDFFSSSTSRAGGGFAETLAGPVGGLIGDVGRAGVSNLARIDQGKAPLIGRDIANLGRRYNPAATFWPTRTALDRMVWDQLQALVDPEAEEQWRRAEKRQQREFGNQSWWRRGEMLPRRGPDMSNILGAQ